MRFKDNLASKGESMTAYNFYEQDTRFIDIDFHKDLVDAENLFFAVIYKAPVRRIPKSGRYPT